MDRRGFLRMIAGFVAGAAVGVDHTPVSPYPRRPTPTPTPPAMPQQFAWRAVESDYAKWGEQMAEGIFSGLQQPITLQVAYHRPAGEVTFWREHEVVIGEGTYRHEYGVAHETVVEHTPPMRVLVIEPIYPELT